MLGHQGRITPCQRERLSVFWTGITHDTDATIDSCVHCQRYRPSNLVRDLYTQVQHRGPMDDISMDNAQLDGYTMLVATDYYSNFIWMTYIVDQTSTAILEALMLIFYCNDYLRNLINERSDNMTCHEI